MADPARSSQSRDPVAVALGWLIGEELARAGRVRDDDLRAAARALSLPGDDLAALETSLRELVLRECDDPEVLSSIDRAAMLVFFDKRDIEQLPGSEPPWHLVALTARLRIGEKRNRLIQAVPEFNVSTGASLREYFEQPLLERIARLVRAAVRRRTIPPDEPPVSVTGAGLFDRPFLHLEGAASPATLLRPAYGVVPFDDSAGQLRRLIEWTDEDAPRSVVALLGPAGSGKTRLAIELCRAMSQRGWRTGMITRSAIIDPASVAAVMQWDARRVLVVDYAEDRPDHVQHILTLLHGAGSRAQPIRLLLAMRRPFGAGWRSAFRGSDGDDILDGADELDVIDAWQHVDRRRFFQSAQAAFGSHLGFALPPRRAPEWVEGPTLDRPLLLAAAALTDLLADTTSATPVRSDDVEDVISALLSHEANYWRGAPASRNEPADRAVTARAIIAGALGQPRHHLTEAAVTARLAYAVDLADEPIAARRQWARWLLKQYPEARLEPDLLLEQMVIEQCSQGTASDPIDWVAALAADRSSDDLAATLTLISRVAEHNADFAKAVTGAWSRALGPLLDVARVICNADDDLVTSLASTAKVLPVTTEIEDIALALPDDERFVVIGGALIRKTVAALRARGIDDERTFTALLALGVYSGRLSEHDDAIAATTQAVDWVRRAAADGDPERRAELAVSLSNLGGDLAEAGEHAAAVTATQEAVDLCRELLKEHASDAMIGLAAALQNLGGCLTTAGDHPSALAATSEAVELIRGVAAPEQDAEQFSLALTNLALCFLHLHEAKPAVDAAQESVTLWRSLVGHTSTDYDAQLMRALSTLATARTRNGEEDIALERRRETVALARRLYANDPQQWHYELTRQLRILARDLASQQLIDEEAKIQSEVESLAARSEH